MKFVELFLTTLQEHLCMGKSKKSHRNMAPLERLFGPVFTSSDKILNGKKQARFAFRLRVYTGLEDRTK